MFCLSTLCHITIRVEPYRVQNTLTQWHKWQQFVHVWENCKQPPRCLWCGGGQLHKECPNMMQLSVGGRREDPSRKISELQTYEGGDAEKSLRGHPGLHRVACSFPTLPLQASSARRCSEARQRNSLGYIRWQVPTQWSTGSLRLYTNRNSKKQVIQFGPQK
jgi:hypothetical protein